MKSNLNSIISKNIFKKKTDIIVMLFLIILQITLLVGISYFGSIQKFWNNYSNNSYDFNLALVTAKDENVAESLYHELKNNSHIKDVFYYDEFISFGVFTDYVKDNINGEVELFGTVQNTKKIIIGEDISEPYTMICPTNFLPDSLIYSGTYDVKNIVNLTDKLGEKISINYGGKHPINLKLVGIFDGSYDFSNPNACYVSHETLKKLNDQYQPDLQFNKKNIYILLDDINNANLLMPNDNIINIRPIKTLKKEVGHNAIGITGIVSLILSVLLFILIYALLCRRIKNEYKNIGILSLVGYSKKFIKKLYYREFIFVLLISLVLSNFIAYYILENFVSWFLFNSPLLSLIDVSLNPIAIIITGIVSVIILRMS